MLGSKVTKPTSGGRPVSAIFLLVTVNFPECSCTVRAGRNLVGPSQRSGIFCGEGDLSGEENLYINN
jgi:hypothetical protein